MLNPVREEKEEECVHLFLFCMRIRARININFRIVYNFVGGAGRGNCNNEVENVCSTEQ